MRGRPEITVGNTLIRPLSDGRFHMPADFVVDLSGSPVGIAAQELPIGSFLVPGEEPMLIDLGFGPSSDELLTGGGLPGALRAAGVLPADVRRIALSHPHPDHLGWLADGHGHPLFPNAELIISELDWQHFVVGHRDSVAPHLLAGLDELARVGRVRLLAGEERIAPTITAVPAPGHTPGHTVFAVHDGGERALLLGDAVHCPQQLTEPEWGAVSDLDPALAAATRRALMRDLERHDGLAVGCHFPDLAGARVLQRR